MEDHGLTDERLRALYQRALATRGERTGCVEPEAILAVVRREGALEVRVHNPSPDPTTVSFPGRTGSFVDLRGRHLAPFDGGFPLGPWAVATARLSDPA